MKLNGKRVLLTGATGGLGRAIAAALAGAEAELVLSSRKRDELEELAGGLPGSGHSVEPSDLAEPGAVHALVEACGRIDVLVANAALPASGLLDDYSAEQIERAVRVNLEVPILLTRELVPPMRERGEGHVVLISSLAGKAASPRASLYNATKFGLRGFGLALREDLAGARSGVGVSVVLPGFVRGAGMFADSGAQPPPGVGTATPEQVGAGVRTAIERNRGEVPVAPLQQRALAGFAHAFPAIAARAQRGAGTKLAEELAGGQTEKR